MHASLGRRRLLAAASSREVRRTPGARRPAPRVGAGAVITPGESSRLGLGFLGGSLAVATLVVAFPLVTLSGQPGSQGLGEEFQQALKTAFVSD